MMEFCIDLPKREGFKLYYLPRGVMTWAYGVDWPLPVPLEESWAMDAEDIQRHRPDGVWWFGCGALDDGAHVSLSRLRGARIRHGGGCAKSVVTPGGAGSRVGLSCKRGSVCRRPGYHSPSKMPLK